MISPIPIRSSEIIEKKLIEKCTHLFEGGFHIRSMDNCNHLKAITTSLFVEKKPFPKRKKDGRNKYHETEVVEDTHKQLLLFISFQTGRSECAASSRDAHTHVRRPLDCTRATHS